MSRAMKNSGIPWIGEIPQEWEMFRLKVCIENSFAGIWGDDAQNNDNDVRCVRVADFNYNELNLSDKNSTKRNIEKSVFDQRKISPNDILLEKSGGGEKTPVGRAVYVNLNEKAVCSNFVHCVRVNKRANSKFIVYMFSNMYNRKVNLLYFNQTTGIQNLNVSDYLNNPICLPQIDEQQAIADFLDVKSAEVDELIALQVKMIDELKVYKQSVITETVTKGLNPDAPLKDSGIEWIGQIPEHWKIVPFKTTYRLTKGLTITKADLIENGVPVISYGQIHSKLNTGTNISDSLIRYVPESFITDNNNSLVCNGDIIFADTSEDLEGCGNCVYIDRRMVLFAGYHTIIAKNTFGLSSKYIAYLFKTDCWRYQLRTSVNGVKLFSISQKILANTSVILPSEIEQQQIADYLDTKCVEIDEMTSIKQQKIEQFKEYKKSIIYEYVTGKKQVNIE